MMHWRQSFRFRIMAMTIVVSGIVLLAFGVEVRWALYAIKVSTVDQDLRTLPFREYTRNIEGDVFSAHGSSYSMGMCICTFTG